MRINHVQERLIGELMDYAKMKYPEIELGEITDSQGSSNHVWVIVKGIDWNDDDKVMDFMEYVADKQEDVLIDYGLSYQSDAYTDVNLNEFQRRTLNGNKI